MDPKNSKQVEEKKKMDFQVALSKFLREARQNVEVKQAAEKLADLKLSWVSNSGRSAFGGTAHNQIQKKNFSPSREQQPLYDRCKLDRNLSDQN